MDTSILGAVGVVAMIVLLGGGFYFFKLATPLADLSGHWKCVGEAAKDGTITKHVIYISDGKMRADSTITVPGQDTIESHVITDGAYSYMWSSLAPDGFKAPVTPPGEQRFDLSSGYSNNCQSWEPDPSLFVVPVDIVFRSGTE